jgi:hypothetical protein
MSKPRSPNYPSISLADSIAGIRKVYEKDHHSRMSKVVVANHLGYGGLNGASLGAISALGKYGLLEAVDDDFRVSQDGITIVVDPPESSDRTAAIRRAALRPALFADLHQHFGGRVPSEENLRAHLQKTGFIPHAAMIAAKSYRDTMELVSREGGMYDPAQEGKPGGSTMEATLPPTDRLPAGSLERALKATFDPQQGGEGSESLKVRVSPQCTASLLFDGPVTQRAIDKLIKQLELVRDDYPSEEQGPQ